MKYEKDPLSNQRCGKDSQSNKTVDLQLGKCRQDPKSKKRQNE